MKQVKVGTLVVYQGSDSVAREYAAGLVRQVGTDTYTLDLAAEVARGDRTNVWIDWDTVVVVEDTADVDNANKWVLAPTNVWQTTLSQLEMIGSAVRGWLSGEHSPAEAIELVREQVGDDR